MHICVKILIADDLGAGANSELSKPAVPVVFYILDLAAAPRAPLDGPKGRKAPGRCGTGDVAYKGTVAVLLIVMRCTSQCSESNIKHRDGGDHAP